MKDKYEWRDIALTLNAALSMLLRAYPIPLLSANENLRAICMRALGAYSDSERKEGTPADENDSP